MSHQGSAQLPSVSVVVAAYNEEEHIARLLVSLREQTLPPIEVIVADDGSQDRTAEIAEAEGATVLRLDHRGPAAARNAGARAASGEVLAFLDGDMACAPEYIERLVAPIASGSAAGTFTRDLYIANTDNRWARAYAAMRGAPPGRLLPADGPDRSNIFRAIRRDRFLEVGGFDDIGYGEDVTLAPKLGELALVAREAVCFHYHPSSLREIFENGRWIGRGPLARNLRRPWWSNSPLPIVLSALKQIAEGRTPWVLPARLIYHAGVLLGLAESSVFPERHWK